MARNKNHQTRRLGFETLEARQLMAANIFLDFGEAFQFDSATGNHVFEDFIELFTEANEILDPTQTDFSVLPANLDASLMNTLDREGIDYDEDGGVDADDLRALGQDVADLVRRIYEPFDVNVQIVASSNHQQVLDLLSASESNDAYIFVAGQASRKEDGSVANFGAAWRDDGNQSDNVGFVAADTMGRSYQGWRFTDSFTTKLANVAAHEAGHTFGISHVYDTVSTAEDDTIMDISDTLTGGIGLALATRGVGFGSESNGLQETYQVLADNLGLKPYGPAYVTGTGGDDVIQIDGIPGSTRAQVTVSSFRWGEEKPQAEFSYSIDTRYGILIEAGMGNDEVTVNDVARVEVRGGHGNDTLETDGGASILQGDKGNDVLRGLGGNDTYVFGGPRSWYLGDDTIQDESGRDTLDFSTFQHAIQVDLAAQGWQVIDRTLGKVYGGLEIEPQPYGDPDTYYLKLRMDNLSGSHIQIENVIGSEYSDLIYGNDANNRLNGLGGDDHLEGLGGKDTLWGDEGDDVLKGGDARDSLYGGDGMDRLYGDEGDDVLKGGDARDYLFGGNGLDRLYGDGGDDFLDGGSDNFSDVLTGGSGRDTFFAWYGSTQDLLVDYKYRWDTIQSSRTRR